MFLLNQMSAKPLWIKKVKIEFSLKTEFCKRIDQQSDGAGIVVVGFEWYCEESLNKVSAWKSRESNGKGGKKEE